MQYKIQPRQRMKYQRKVEEKSKIKNLYKTFKDMRLKKKIRKSFALFKKSLKRNKVEIKSNKSLEPAIQYQVEEIIDIPNEKVKKTNKIRKALSLLGLCMAVGATSYTISYNTVTQKNNDNIQRAFYPTKEKIENGEMKYVKEHNAWYVLDKRTNQYILVDNKDIGKKYHYDDIEDQYYLNDSTQYDEYYEYKQWYSNNQQKDIENGVER